MTTNYKRHNSMLGPLGGLSSNLFKPINEIIKQCEIDQNTQKVNWQKIHAFFNWTMERKKKKKKQQHANIRGKLLFSSKQTYKHYTYNDNDRERWAGKRIINVSCLVEETALKRRSGDCFSFLFFFFKSAVNFVWEFLLPLKTAIVWLSRVSSVLSSS